MHSSGGRKSSQKIPTLGFTARIWYHVDGLAFITCYPAVTDVGQGVHAGPFVSEAENHGDAIKCLLCILSGFRWVCIYRGHWKDTGKGLQAKNRDVYQHFHPRQAALKESRNLSLFMPPLKALPRPPNDLKSNEVNEKDFTASAQGPV